MQFGESVPLKKMQIILTNFLFNIYTLGRLSRKENNERTALCLRFYRIYWSPFSSYIVVNESIIRI
jgi:hypothetical protein